jgi:hypothetical protein
MSTTIQDMSNREILNAAYLIGRQLNRKFEASDISGANAPILMQAARLFAATYEGDFEYMVEMANNVATFGSLSVNQSKGVLNCLMAQARKNLEAKAREQATTPKAQAPVATTDYSRIPDGTFTVVFDAANPSDYLTVRVERWDDFTDRRTGKARDDVRSFKYLAGPDNTADFQFAAAISPDKVIFSAKAFGPRQQQALALLAASSADKIAEMGAAYAFASSRCWRCHRELTVEDSVAGGIGPVCAKKVGAAYGVSALEAAKAAMARLQAKTAAPVAAPTHQMFTADGVEVTVSHDRYTELFGEDEAA